MCPDDRFLLQGEQILPEICQVRPMPRSQLKEIWENYYPQMTAVLDKEELNFLMILMSMASELS